MDWREDTDANDHQDQKDVAAHADKSQEDGRVHANLAHEIRFASLPQRCDPRPWLFADRRRRMFLVGVFQSWSI